MEYSKDISTCDAAYVLEPFKKGDKFPAEVVKYATDLSRKISLKALSYDITKTFADYNSGDFFSKSEKVLYWWHTPECYKINILDIVNQIVLHFSEVEFCYYRNPVLADALEPEVYMKGNYREEAADYILVVESNNQEIPSLISNKLKAEQRENRVLFPPGRVVHSKLFDSVDAIVSKIEAMLPSWEFKYLLWDKRISNFQIEVRFYKGKKWLSSISRDDRLALKGLDENV